MPRFAIVRNASSRSQLEAYLPGNYRIVSAQLDETRTHLTHDALDFIISGEDNAGWTLDGYVIPRLASGLIWAEEIPEPSEIDLDARPFTRALDDYL